MKKKEKQISWASIITLNDTWRGSKTIMKKVQIIPLGGLGEVGKNMTVIRYEDDIYIVDAGLAFPEDDAFGVDVIIPDFDYLRKNRKQIKKIIITHAHEDHIGALSYFTKEFPEVPVYATRLTAAIIKNKLKHDKVTIKSMNIIHEKSKIRDGSCEITFFPTNHSIPDSLGVVIQTPVGSVVHTGDFKIDYTPVDGRYTDFQRLGEIGKKGVLALLSDSTNAEKPGISLSEKKVGHNLENEMRACQGRIIIATFASSLYRIQNIFQIAERMGKKVAVVGRSMENNVKEARKLGFLLIGEGVYIDADDVKKYPSNEIIVLTTGAQGEVMAGLSRIVNGDHKIIELEQTDTIMFSSSPIPGNEKTVSALIDMLYRKGISVVYERERGIHASGHGYQDEQKLMLSVLRPKYFIPCHGEHRMLVKHGWLAESIGVESEHIFVLENGDVLEINDDGATIVDKIQAGPIFVDNSGLGDIDAGVFKDRRRLAEHGVAVIQVTCPPASHMPIKVEFVLKGISANYDKNLLKKDLLRVISEKMKGKHNLGELKRELYSEVGTVLYRTVKKSPTLVLLINNFKPKEGFGNK